MGLPTRRSRALLITTLAITLACADRGPDLTPSEIRILGDKQISLPIGESATLAVECLNERGQVIQRAYPAWVIGSPTNFPDRPGRVTLEYEDGRAYLRAISEGQVIVAVGCVWPSHLSNVVYGYYPSEPGHPDVRIDYFQVDVTAPVDTAWTIDAGSDSLRLRAPTAEDSTTGVSQLLTPRSGVGALAALDPATFAWSSDHPTVATVSADGLVRAAGPGVTTIRVARDERSIAVPVRVEEALPTPTWDIALVDAHWTQGAQDAEQRVPMIRNGRAAVVNVTAFATAGAPAATVTLQVWDAAGALIHTANTALRPTTDSAPSFGAPAAQFLVPDYELRRAVRWRVARDDAQAWDAGVVPDADPSNDALPRTGSALLSAIEAAPLRLRLLPLRLAGNGNATAMITPEQIAYYDAILRGHQPLADVVVSIEPPLTVDASIPTAAELESAPDLEQWYRSMFVEMLAAVDERRLASGTGREDYWLGVFPKPSPDAVSLIAGRAYISSRPSQTGPFARSMIARSHDWYESPERAGSTVSHELGHSLGLRHSPACSAPGPDPAYPVEGGGVGEWVHWVSAWEDGAASQAVTIAPDSGDFMGYCKSDFVSPYHTRLIIEWRAMSGANLMAPAIVTRVLAIRGVLTDRAIVVRTPRIVDAETYWSASGDVMIELLAADGRVLAEGAARTGVIAESSDIPFVAHIPLDPALEAELASVRVRSASLATEVTLELR